MNSPLGPLDMKLCVRHFNPPRRRFSLENTLKTASDPSLLGTLTHPIPKSIANAYSEPLCYRQANLRREGYFRNQG